MSNIITIKMKLKERIDNPVFENFQKKFSNIVHISFNLFKDGYTKYEIFNKVQEMNNIECLDVTWMREAVKIGESIWKSAVEKNKENKNKTKRNKTLKPIFGYNRKDFYNRLKGKINREDYLKLKSYFYISCEGSKSDKSGNRKFKFDISTFTGTVMLNDKKKISFSCYKPGKNQYGLIQNSLKLAYLGEMGITYRINKEYLYICIDIDKLPKENRIIDRNRTLALDMNPNYIGLSIMDKGDSVIFKKMFDLTKIHNNNKRNSELIEIAKNISKLCYHYNVYLVGYEKLSMISGDKKKGKKLNKMINNDWCRERFINSLHKWLGLIGCDWREISPEYSSFIGCINNSYDTDSIAASIELNRRLRLFQKVYVDKTIEKPDVGIIYPEFSMHPFNHWKESLGDKEFSGWKESYKWFKETKTSYRLPPDKWIKNNNLESFSFKSYKSRVISTSVTLCNI